jgi:hypothetical protein
MLRSAAKSYTRALERHPLSTNLASAFVIFTIGDISAQYIEHQERRTAQPFMVDTFRSSKLINWSVFIYTPVFYKLYQYFDIWWPKKTPINIARKVLGASASAIPTNAIFFGYNAAYPHLVDYALGDIETLPVQRIYDETKEKCSDELVNTIQASMTLWWPVNAANFAFVPGTYRSVWTSAWSVVWSTYLSLIAHRPPTNTTTESSQMKHKLLQRRTL